MRSILLNGFLLCAVFSGTTVVEAQTRLMPIGDSITQGGQNHASYRYELWFDLTAGGYGVDFVGGRDFTNDGNPNLSWYPDYFTTFDRDHEGYWGWRTDEIAGIILAAATAAQPDVVMIHLGTNDIGQLGAAGVANADTNLRLIIDRLRSVRPNVTILLAQVIPIGPGTSYFANAGQVGPLNAVIATIAGEMTTAQSPVLLIDQNGPFDLATMMQSDGLHPNLAGEAQIADVWRSALESLLPGNPLPTVTITSPVDGAEPAESASISIAASASDANGFVSEVRFFADGALLGVDTSAPFIHEWVGAAVGNHVLEAVAEDDEGATRTSNAVGITVLPPPGGVSLNVLNPSFETPPLSDGALASGPGMVGDWVFSGTANTFVGIFDPPDGSYPDAGGEGTPLGADGANVAFLFNNGGASESVSAEQALGVNLQADSDYLLTVAVGKFLPDQPYVFSTWGGYSIELLAGTTVIGSSTGPVDPPFGRFRDALVPVSADEVDSSLIGQPLSIRLGLPTDEAPRSTHFDDVRLTRFDVASAGAVPSLDGGPPLRIDRVGDDLLLSWGVSCEPADSDYAVYEGLLGEFAGHEPRRCTTGAVSSELLTPGEGDRYYLVVPRNTNREGSYGVDGLGFERPPSPVPCAGQRSGACG